MGPRTHTATIRVPARPDAFEAALEGLTRVNVGLMQQGDLPRLYEAGVRYKDEPRDVWRHAADVVGEKWGDCEDLSAYRAAELRVSGEDPDARVITYQSGPSRYHAVVARGDGSFEDPSRVLGMGQPKMRQPRPRATANVLGADTTPDGAMSFEIIAIPGGWGRRGGYRGYVKLPVGVLPSAAGPQAIYSVGPQVSTPVQAAASATQAALSELAKNPAIRDALAKVPGVSQAAQVLTNPTVEAALKNPASLLNLQAALARPDIALQNAGKAVDYVKKLFG